VFFYGRCRKELHLAFGALEEVKWIDIVGGDATARKEVEKRSNELLIGITQLAKSFNGHTANMTLF
jgi:hypothetical protein